MRKTAAVLSTILVALTMAMVSVAANGGTITVGGGVIATLGSTTTVNITLDAAPNGLSGYIITVSLDDPAVADITGVIFPSWATITDSSGIPGDSVWMKAVDLNDVITDGATNIDLGTLTIEGVADGETTFSVTVGRLEDDDGNLSTPTIVSGTLRVDTIPPTVTVEQKVGQPDPANATPVLFTVTFDEIVTGLTAGDFSLGGTATGQVASLTGSGSTYELSVDTITGDGTVVPSIPAGVAVDVAGHPNEASTSTDNSVTYDTASPTLTTVTIASSNANTTLAKVGDTVTVTFVSDEDLLASPVVTIDGNVADAVTQGADAQHWTATRLMQTGDTEGVVPFTIDFDDLAGNVGTQVTATTDASSVTFEETLPTIPGPHGVPPLDGDGDGLYEDLNGNGVLDFADVVLFFNQIAWIENNEPVSCFDFNHNGRIDYDDMVTLFDMIT